MKNTDIIWESLCSWQYTKISRFYGNFIPYTSFPHCDFQGVHLSEILGVRRIWKHRFSKWCANRTEAKFCSHGYESAELHLLKTPFSLTLFPLVAVSFFHQASSIYFFIYSIVYILREDREKHLAKNTFGFSKSVHQFSTKPSLFENTIIKVKEMNMIAYLP